MEMFKRFLRLNIVAILIILSIIALVEHFPVDTTISYKISFSMVIVGLLGYICTVFLKKEGKTMIEVGTQEKIVEFEIPVFRKTETCTVLEFSKDENEELEIEIPAFMRG